VSDLADNLYARWRHTGHGITELHDGETAPPERLLQTIWQHQRIHRDGLVTLDGRTVRILHPGFLNVESGPDFRGAVIQFDNDPPASGDVEVDLHPWGWQGHGHYRNPSFRSVILHVVWSGLPRSAGGPPILSIGGCLDAPLDELAAWLDREGMPALPEAAAGRCSAAWSDLAEPELLELLRQAAIVRLRGKAARFAARAREAGWDQSLWEGLFRALGYKHNTWPMQRLGELRPRWQHDKVNTTTLQARLLGIANLLPGNLTGMCPEADDHVRKLWDEWWRDQAQFADCQIPKSLWRLHGTRPLNHPQRRIALAAHWLSRKGFLDELERWALQEICESRPGAKAALMKILLPQNGSFWADHMTLRSALSSTPLPLLGAAQVTELAVNVILPWLLARGETVANTRLITAIESAACSWPASNDNRVLKLGRARLLGGASRNRFRTAGAQQGLLQIVHDFCDHSNAVCDGCKLPALLNEWIYADAR
jgi:hypothetical protein